MSILDFLAILHGAVATVALSLSGIALGAPLGLMLALVRWTRTPVIAPVVAAYLSIMRATPAVTLAPLIFSALPNAGIEIDPVPTAVLTLMLNTAAFNCEIWRAALVDFPREHLDASVSFGMGGCAAFLCIIVPQIYAHLPAGAGQRDEPSNQGEPGRGGGWHCRCDAGGGAHWRRDLSAAAATARCPFYRRDHRRLLCACAAQSRAAAVRRDGGRQLGNRDDRQKRAAVDDLDQLVAVTHEMGFARDAATRMVFIDRGQVVETRTPAQFIAAPATVPRQFLQRYAAATAAIAES